MSWDAEFSIRAHDQWIAMGDWNYTHNTNRMIQVVEPGWYRILDGQTGAEGSAILERIVLGWEASPKVFRSMNPENGWGSYDTLLPVLKNMLAVSLQFPAGFWQVTG